MNFKNLSENLIIILFIMILTSITVYKVTMKASLEAHKQTTELLIPTIIKAIQKETTKIENNLTNTFEKKSFKKGEDIQIIIDPTTNSVISNADTSQVITVEKKKGFLKRLFNKTK